MTRYNWSRLYEQNSVLWHSKYKEYRNGENKDKVVKEMVPNLIVLYFLWFLSPLSSLSAEPVPHSYTQSFEIVVHRQLQLLLPMSNIRLVPIYAWHLFSSFLFKILSTITAAANIFTSIFSHCHRLTVQTTNTTFNIFTMDMVLSELSDAKPSYLIPNSPTVTVSRMDEHLGVTIASFSQTDAYLYVPRAKVLERNLFSI